MTAHPSRIFDTGIKTTDIGRGIRILGGGGLLAVLAIGLGACDLESLDTSYLGSSGPSRDVLYSDGGGYYGDYNGYHPDGGGYYDDHASRPRFRVIDAHYGTKERHWDVTGQLYQYVQPNGTINVRVTNESMGGDPAKHEDKYLWVRYWFDGRQLTKRVPEKGYLALP